MSLDSVVRDIEFEELPVALQVKKLAKRVSKLEQKGETAMLQGTFKRKDGSGAVGTVVVLEVGPPVKYRDSEYKEVFAEGAVTESNPGTGGVGSPIPTGGPGTAPATYEQVDKILKHFGIK